MDIALRTNQEHFIKQTRKFDINNFLAPSKSNKEKAEKASTDFESFFLYQMLELTDPGSTEEFNGGAGEDMFRSIKNEYISKEITKSGEVGLADTIYSQLIKLQEEN